MLKSRIMCLLSATLLVTSYNVNAQTPLKATEVVKNYDNIEIHKTDFQVQYEKDKAESDRIEAEKQRQEELRKIEEANQRQKDLICYYNPNNITEISGISIQKAYELLQGTTYQTLECAEEFVNAEKLNPSVNAICLIAITKKESLHGKSGLAKLKHNIFSWRTPNRGDGWKTFDSKAQCIRESSQLLSNEYLQTNGKYYYKGFGIENVNHYFCEGSTWANDVNEIIDDIKHGRF